MTFREQLLYKLGACDKSLEWVKDKTIEEAWETCENTSWMLWILIKTDLDLIDPICDIAEGVLHLVPEDIQLACIWAISAARRRADIDELNAAWSAATAATYCTDDVNDVNDVNDAAAACASYSTAARAAATAVIDASDADYYNTSYIKEQKKQCDIFRKYFTIDQIKEAFNKLVS